MLDTQRRPVAEVTTDSEGKATVGLEPGGYIVMQSGCGRVLQSQDQQRQPRPFVDLAFVIYESAAPVEPDRLCVSLGDRPDSPSEMRITRRSPRWRVMNSNTSAVVTPPGSFSIIEKNTFKSYPAASTVFGRPRAATNSKYRSTSGCPSRNLEASDPPPDSTRHGIQLNSTR